MLISAIRFCRSTLLTSGQENDQAPPKRLANALEGLGRAIRHIADIRSGADLLLEALEAAALIRGRETGNKKASDGIQKAADTIGKALEELSATGITFTASTFCYCLKPGNPGKTFCTYITTNVEL